MIQTEFLHFLRALREALYTYCVYDDVEFGVAWPLWQDGLTARQAARAIAEGVR